MDGGYGASVRYGYAVLCYAMLCYALPSYLADVCVLRCGVGGVGGVGELESVGW